MEIMVGVSGGLMVEWSRGWWCMMFISIGSLGCLVGLERLRGINMLRGRLMMLKGGMVKNEWWFDGGWNRGWWIVCFLVLGA